MDQSEFSIGPISLSGWSAVGAVVILGIVLFFLPGLLLGLMLAG
jgi:hypothetical protein